MTWRVSQNVSFWFLSEDVSFSAYSYERSQMFFLRFPRNSDFKLFNQKTDVTLWDECTQHKAAALHASLQYSSEVVSLQTTSPGAPLKNTSKISQRQSFHTGQCGVSFKSLKWMHTLESIFLERFFLGFISGYFTFRDRFQHIEKYHFFTFRRTLFKQCLMMKEV